MSHLFSPVQLQVMAQPYETPALAALADGDLPQVLRHLREMAIGHAGLDALSAHSVARKIGKLRADFGEVRAREMLVRVGTQLMSTWVTQWRDGQVRVAIEDLIAVHRYQGDAVLGPIEKTTTR